MKNKKKKRITKEEKKQSEIKKYENKEDNPTSSLNQKIPSFEASNKPETPPWQRKDKYPIKEKPIVVKYMANCLLYSIL